MIMSKSTKEDAALTALFNFRAKRAKDNIMFGVMALAFLGAVAIGGDFDQERGAKTEQNAPVPTLTQKP